MLGGGSSFPTDTHSHGTHTTGTMTGVAYDDTIGVAWEAEWIACNAIDQGASPGFDNDIIEAFQWFADPDGDPGTVDDMPDVVQNSWGINEGFPGDYTDCDTRWWSAIDNCEAAGVVTVWSAGNEGRVFVWGKNDQLELNKLNKLHKLNNYTKTMQFMDLLNLHKIYFGLKNDLGLFNLPRIPTPGVWGLASACRMVWLSRSCTNATTERSSMSSTYSA